MILYLIPLQEAQSHLSDGQGKDPGPFGGPQAADLINFP